MIKRWRFGVTDFDDNETMVDSDGGPDGDEPAAEFVGDSSAAIDEGDRRALLWENRTGGIAAKVTRYSHGAA
jgi:hypothetical protein